MRKKKTPNILFMISDDHQHNAIHALGNSTLETPNLDYLVNQGVAFTQTHIMGGMSGAVCAPSRASVHSGANPFRTGGDVNINSQLALLGETLKEHSYHTYAIGKWHNDIDSFQRSFCDGKNIFFGGMSDHFSVPVHDYQPDGEYSEKTVRKASVHTSELFADTAVSFLNEYDKEDPFFLYVAFTAPHDPRQAPSPYHDMYEEESIELPPNFLDQHPFDNGEMNIRDEQLVGIPREKDNIRQHTKDYYAMVTHMDKQIGNIFETLKEKGILEDTIIIYTSDHGLALGQHGLMGKQNMYDHSTRIPFLMKGPGLPVGEKRERLSYQIDIFPTLFDMINLPIPTTVEGKSLCAMLNDPNKKEWNTVYTKYLDIQRMVKDERWKLIKYYVDDQNVGSDCIQLFDLQQDPWEIHNLAGKETHLHILEYLTQEMKKWQFHLGDPLRHIAIDHNTCCSLTE
ncbi:sulfatase-like hydrolase/transferase [Bacillaceae bacterium SIJ1]|uniref:sulfatase-like hydrolase/transferase n=1 Tax=Litoribacterium kuwaitense TaxID=1398745 RepID=UPI0013EB1C24|nr:sulfatase-like hydrolase/transferase [Litoribacterium kuwaitense]NGP45423.1 sulfatase-like hydrolase/transferase [Litoribacterium kuwaitense]